MAGTYTVGQINSYIKNMFQQDFVLNRISIKGEISNCKYHTSGHIYFTLKDETGTIAAVMFAGNAKGMKLRLTEGLKVVVSGKIDIYERDGRYQLYAYHVEAIGAGDLYKQFAELKQKLEEMGMFAPEYKRPIPKFAARVGIVTAGTGAAVQDIINITKRRNPYVQLVLYPSLVQGERAKYSIVKGIQKLDTMGLDVIIVGRGGGSIEDLWAFNEEMVANAIFDAATPIISAVGHETDFTIADFVADLRAPTPSAAAELAVMEIQGVLTQIDGYRAELNRAMEYRIEAQRNRLEQYRMKLSYLNPVSQANDQRQLTMEYEEKLNRLLKQLVQNQRHQLAIYSERLNGISPLLKMSKGYAYVENASKEPVFGVNEVRNGDSLYVHMTDGCIRATVDQIEVK